MDVRCKECGAKAELPPVSGKPGYVSIENLDDWYFTTKTGWLCPDHKKECD